MKHTPPTPDPAPDSLPAELQVGAPVDGAPLEQATKSRLVPWLIAMPVVGFGLIYLIGAMFSTPQGEDMWLQQETIKICWKEVARAPEERQSDRFQNPSDCERLEFDFKSQYQQNP